MNRVDIELAGDAGFGFVFSKAEHAKTRNQHNGRAGIAQSWGVGQSMLLIVTLIVFAILSERFVNLALERRKVATFHPIHKHGPDLGANEVVRAACTQKRQVFGVSRIYKLENIFRVAETSDPSPLATEAAAQKRENLESQILTIGSRFCCCSSEPGISF